MKKATINIEVVGDSRYMSCSTKMEGETGAIMIGLTNAIKELEIQVPEENRADYRVRILEMMNDKH